MLLKVELPKGALSRQGSVSPRQPYSSGRYAPPKCRAFLPTAHRTETPASSNVFQVVGCTLAASAVAIGLLLQSSAEAREPFLSSTGGKGLLADEEAVLVRLRQELETEAREELERARKELEAQALSSQGGRLCATPFGVDVVGITEAVALTGALVGGYAARQKREEVEVLNEQLRKINLQLRQQARAGTLYAPGLTYVPPSPPPATGTRDVSASAAAAPVAPAPPVMLTEPVLVKGGPNMLSMDEEEQSPEARHCLKALKEGKGLLKQQNGASAMVRFEKALMLAKSLGNKVQERRAVRGLAAAARLQGQHKAAIQHLQRVLEISKDIGDKVGDADAYGTIADIYTDIGEFEKAAHYYDKYIAKMGADGSPV